MTTNSNERASIFDDDMDIDVSSFAARPKARATEAKADREMIRAVAEERGFPSREALKTQAPYTEAPKPELQKYEPQKHEPMLQRRYRTGRNRQLNLKVTDEALRRFYALADLQGKVLGEVFEQAVEALEAQLSDKAR
jgi:hypothetical protein